MTHNALRHDYIKLASAHSEFIAEVITHAHDRRDPILEDLARDYKNALQENIGGNNA